MGRDSSLIQENEIVRLLHGHLAEESYVLYSFVGTSPHSCDGNVFSFSGTVHKPAEVASSSAGGY
jgi:hypothetical protein